MATTIEYALLAGASYYDTRDQNNRFPVPQNWGVVSRVPQDGSTGFEASTYKNTLTNEIVISFAGTYPTDILGDQAANFGLGTGNGSAQLGSVRQAGVNSSPAGWVISTLPPASSLPRHPHPGCPSSNAAADSDAAVASPRFAP